MKDGNIMKNKVKFQKDYSLSEFMKNIDAEDGLQCSALPVAQPIQRTILIAASTHIENLICRKFIV
jgi:hypothetical protein